MRYELTRVLLNLATQGDVNIALLTNRDRGEFRATGIDNGYRVGMLHAWTVSGREITCYVYAQDNAVEKWQDEGSGRWEQTTRHGDFISIGTPILDIEKPAGDSWFCEQLREAGWILTEIK